MKKLTPLQTLLGAAAILGGDELMTDECPPAGTGYACDYARHKRDAPCDICPLKGRNLTVEESESLRIADGIADEKRGRLPTHHDTTI
jgi:hypothetical protein